MLGNLKARQRGFAILMVVLVLVALAIIGAPFAISMRQEEQTSIHFAARVRAKLAAEAALNFALYQLEQTHEFNEAYNAQNGVQTIYDSPSADSAGEFRVDLQDAALSGMEIANPAGVMWGVQVTDEQGKVNLRTASRALLHNLAYCVLGDDARAVAISNAILQYRDVQRCQFTALTQLREVPVSPRLTAAEFDRLTPFLTVHSASLVGDVPSHSLALHPININTCTEEVLRALLLGLRLALQPGDAAQAAAVSPAEVDALIRRLRVFPALSSPVAKNSSAVPLTDASNLPLTGWIAIEGDTVKYTAKTGNSLTVVIDPTDPGYPAGRVDDDHPHADKSNPNYIQTPLDQVDVRLLFTDVESDLAGLLADMVTKGELAADSRSAILANAINPLNVAALDLTTTTAPLSFRSFNIYSIEAHGISSAADGRELARYTVHQVAQVNPCGQLQIKVDTQEEFERSRQGGIASHMATWPNATQVSDIPPSNTDSWAAPVKYALHGRIGLQAAEYSPAGTTSFVARFHNPLKRNVLRGEIPGTNMPDPDAATTVKVDPGADSNLEPEGLYVGEEPDPTTGQPTSRRILVYPARNDTDTSKSNIPQGTDYIQPFVIEMWVKFASKAQFDYSRDHFLFDLAEETFTNRVAIYYDSTGTNEGDLVVHVCGPTKQPTPAQVRYHITEDTFEPQRWYHLAVVVKGSDYGQMALLIDGQNVGRYEPSAVLTADGGATLGCDRLAPYDGANYFAAFTWPQEDCVIVEGELIEHVAAGSNALTVRALPYSGRGARGTLQGVHGAGAHVEIYGYDDLVVPSCDDTSLLPTMDHLPRGAEVPKILGTDKIPAAMALAKVDDGFDGTAASSTAYWKPNPDPTAGYAAVTGLTNNEIPADGWLPIAHSDPWVIEKGGTVADDATAFNKVLQDTTYQGFLAYTGGKAPSTGDHAIEDTQSGFGFFRVESNPGVADGVGEEIKYAKAGVTLVWRWHPEDLGQKEEDRRKLAWYVGYLANFGADDGSTSYARRACFGTVKKDINEGATLRFDCLRLSSFEAIARGRQGPRPPVKIGPIEVPVGNYGGLGVFQLYRDTATCEWVQFGYPQFSAQADELKLLSGVGSAFLAGISRSTCGTGPTPADAHTGYAFVPGDQVMPVLFGGGSVSSRDDQYLPIIKGPGDRVTVTDRTDQREEHYVSHGSGRYFAFREQVTRAFLFNNVPRVLKFPSGNLPLRPDSRFYIGSDSTAFGDQDPYTSKTYNGASPLTSPAEPERPANATFDEIKIYPSSNHPTARLWDVKKTGGAPDPNVAVRGVANIADSDTPPFYLRLGRLERLTMALPAPKPGDPIPPPPEPFRFVIGGEVDWPMEGYAKIDDEVVFYRKMYFNRNGGHGAAIVSDRSADATGLATALNASETEVYVDANSADSFPESGYLSIGGGWPSPKGWQNLIDTATKYAVDPAELAKLGGGYFGLYDSIGAPERAFFQRAEKTTKNGKPVWRLTLVNRGIVDTSPREVKFVPEGTTPSWFVTGATDRGGGSVNVIGVEFLILQRACLGTVAAPHRIGTVLMPLDHIPTSLAVRPLVKLKRGADGKLQRLTTKTDTIRGLRPGDADYAAFDISKPYFEYGILVEDADQFPTEGYVQIGNEILAYVQDRDGADPNVPNSGTPIWNAEVMVWDEAQGKDVPKILPVLTGIRDFRQRFGSGRATYLESVLKSLDPGIPDPALNPGDAGYKTQPTPPYWVMTAKHIVRSLAYRYHDRFPIRPATAPIDTDVSGGYGPHWSDSDLGYYELAVSLPGARWTAVHWAEALYRKANSWVLDNTPLAATDPFDVKVMAQIDGTPGWDDMTLDPATKLLGATQPAQPVSSPVHWLDFVKRDDAYNKDASSHRPLKPVIYLFDQADDPTNVSGQPGNYINPLAGTTVPQLRGQSGDRIRLRVFFQFKKNPNPDRDDSEKVPFYQIPWRTPWIDWISIGYSGPTYVMEHREMPY